MDVEQNATTKAWGSNSQICPKYKLAQIRVFGEFGDLLLHISGVDGDGFALCVQLALVLRYVPESVPESVPGKGGGTPLGKGVERRFWKT